MLRVLRKTAADCNERLDRTSFDPTDRLALDWLLNDLRILLQRLSAPAD